MFARALFVCAVIIGGVVVLQLHINAQDALKAVPQKQLWQDHGTGLLVRELPGVCVYEFTSKQEYGYAVSLQVIPKTTLVDGVGCW